MGSRMEKKGAVAASRKQRAVTDAGRSLGERRARNGRQKCVRGPRTHGLRFGSFWQASGLLYTSARRVDGGKKFVWGGSKRVDRPYMRSPADKKVGKGN